MADETPEVTTETGVNPEVTSAESQAEAAEEKAPEGKDKQGYMRPGDPNIYVETTDGSKELVPVAPSETPHSVKELNADEFDKEFTIVGE